MTAVFEWCLANTAIALVLAVVAFASRWLHRPAITHALWLLVLLRLVAPPVWRMPMPWPSATATATPIVSIPSVELEALPLETEWAAAPEAAPVTRAAPIIEPATPVVEFSMNWPLGGIWVWASGSVCCFVAAAWRIGQFRSLVRRAPAAPDEWNSEAAQLSQQMGLWRIPSVRVMPSAIAPCVWPALARPVLLLPGGLIDQIAPQRRRAIIAHELAHLRRADHVVRWLELAITLILWWNPLVWLARRQLRESEEQLCDAWVVWVLPEARREYAAALVDTVEYLCEPSPWPVRPALPPLASGLGEVRNLKRRIIMIMRERVPHRLAGWALAIGLSLGGALLVISPALADDDPPPPPPPPRAPVAAEPPGGLARRLDPEQAKEAEEIRRHMREIRQQLSRLESRLAEIEGRPAPGRAVGRVRTATTPAPADAPPTPPALPSAPRAGNNFGFGGGGFGGGPGGAAPRGGFGGGFGGAGMGGGPPAFERRMDEMQRSIEKLSRELSDIRRMLRDRQGERRGDDPVAK